MKYRGNFEVTRQLITKDIQATGETSIGDLTASNLVVTTSADMGGVPIKNMGAPVDPGDALTRQYFEDNQIKTTFSTAEPTSSDGVDGGLWMRTAGNSFSPPVSLKSSPLTDNLVLAVTNTGSLASVNIGAADDRFAHTNDSGTTWNETSMQANGLLKGFLLAFRNNRFVVFRQEANGSDKRPSNTTDNGANWGDSTFAVASSGTITITAAESDPKQGTAVVFGSSANPRVMYTQTDGATWQDAFATTGINHDAIVDVTVTNLAAMVLYDGNKIRQTSNFASWAGKTDLTVSGATAPDEWVAISHQTSAGRIVAVGTGGNSQYVATSSNTAGSWFYRDLGVGPLEAYDVAFNKNSEVTVISGANGMFYSTDYTQLTNTTACTITGGTKYPTKLYSDESGNGFYGITDDGIVSVSADGINWTISEEPGIRQMYGKNNGSWTPTDFQTEEDVLKLITDNNATGAFLPSTGGTVTGEIVTDTLKVVTGADMGGAPIKNIGAPVDLTDAVTRKYFEDNKFKTTYTAGSPLDSLGNDGDIVVSSANGEDRMPPSDITGSTPLYDIASDNTTIMVVGNNENVRYVGSSTDGMSNWIATDVGKEITDTLGLAKVNALSGGQFTTWPAQVANRDNERGKFFNGGDVTDVANNWWSNGFFVGTTWTKDVLDVVSDPFAGTGFVLLLDNWQPIVGDGDWNSEVGDATLTGLKFGAMNGTIGLFYDETNNVTVSIDTSNNTVTKDWGWNSSTAFTPSCLTTNGFGGWIMGNTGANSGYVMQISSAGSQSFLNAFPGNPDRNLSAICCNPTSDRVVAVSATDRAIYSGARTGTWSAATINGNLDNMPTKVVAHGSGFIGINEQTGFTSWSDNGSDWNISVKAGIDGLYYKKDGKWLESPYQTESDVINLIVGNSPDTSAFLPTTGGTITGSLTVETGLSVTGGLMTLNNVNYSFVGGNGVFQDGNVSVKNGNLDVENGNLTIDSTGGISLDTGASFNAGSNKITNVAEPTLATDVATKGFVENLAGTSETLTDVAAAGKTYAEFDYTVTPFVFVDVVAYATGKQYMSTVHLMFDGTDVNIQEFGVMSVGGLDIDVDGEYTTGNNARLTAKVLSGETDISVKITPRFR